MKFIKTTDSFGQEIELSYADHGAGKPVVLIHGWPVSKEMWEYQVEPLINSGLRVIKYDRRGFGKSCKPWNGYDYDTLADDLKALLEQLNLNDVTLVGFSMGGGEVARYFGKYGGERITKVVLVSTVLPYMLKTEDNPDGVDASVFEDMMANMTQDRAAFLQDFGKQFFGVNMLAQPVSDAMLQQHWGLAIAASGRATRQCAISFSQTDFRKDIPAINVPTLVIHGDADKIVPIKNSSDRTASMIPNSIYKVYDGAPHGLFITNKDELNRDLLEFIKG